MKTTRLRHNIKAACLALFALGCLAGCGKTYEEAYDEGHKDGHDAGFQEGYAEGKKTGAAQTAANYETKWGFIGLPIGLLIGGALVAFFTREFIASQYQAWKRRRKVTTLLTHSPVDLDPDLHDRVMQIGLRKKKLEDELARDNGKLVETFHGRIHLRLRNMDDSIVKIAALLQQLKTIRHEVAVDERAVRRNIAKLQKTLDGLDKGSEASEIEEAIEIETARLRAAAKNEENIRRCDLKLSMLNGFLDNLIITVGNMRTIEEQDTFERFEHEVSQEVEQLENVFESALANLFTPPPE